MPFNLLASSEAAPGAGTVPVVIGVGETLYPTLDARDAIIVPEATPYVLGVFYAAEATGARAILRQPGKVDKSIQKCCLTTDNDPTQGFTSFMRSPLVLEPKAKLTNLSVNAADEDTIIGVMLGTGPFPTAPFHIDEIITGYADTTLAAANTWETVAITWNEEPKAGTYAVVTMKAGVYLAANLWSTLARLVIPGHPEWRPGVPCALMEADHEEYQSVTMEPYSVWGDIGIRFKAPEQMPNVEFISPSLVTDENVELGLMKV